MKSINELIDEIVTETTNLKEKHFDKESLKIDYICIFTHTSEEYDFYSTEALKLGEIVQERNGIVVELKDPLKLENGELLNLLRVRKPDKQKTRKGYADYKTLDYEKFKSKFKDFQNISFVKASDGTQMMEFKEPNSNVLLYFLGYTLGDELKRSKEASLEKEVPVDKPMEDKNLSKMLEAERNAKLRAMADLANYKKRMEEERSIFGAIANMGIIQEILEVTDDINLSFNDGDLDIKRAKEVLKLAQDKLIAAVRNAGVEKIDIKIGDDFDKEKMEAVSTTQVKDEKQKGKVVAVISSAYKYAARDGVIKHAKVVVGK